MLLNNNYLIIYIIIIFENFYRSEKYYIYLLMWIKLCDVINNFSATKPLKTIYQPRTANLLIVRDIFLLF